MPAVEELARAEGVPIERVERDELDALVGAGVARGVLAIAQPPRSWELDDLLEQTEPRSAGGRRLIVACDGVVDPHNFGAILRSADFFGALGVVWARDRAAPLSATAVRASAGASERVRLVPVTNLARALESAKRAGPWWVVGTVVDAEQSLRDFAGEAPEDLIVVLGSEHKGLRRLTRERCDFLVTIAGARDKAGGMGSLNVSTAAAVILATLR